MTNAASFISPAKAIQAHIDRAYSINVMYRPAIQAPRPITLKPKAEAVTVIARPMPGTPISIHEFFVPQAGGNKRDIRILKANKAPRVHFKYFPATDDLGMPFTLPLQRGHVRTYCYETKAITHAPFKAGIRRHREGL